MTKGLLFWVIFIISLVFQFGVWQSPDKLGRWGWAGGFVVMVLLGLLGWQVFGEPIK